MLLPAGPQQVVQKICHRRRRLLLEHFRTGTEYFREAPHQIVVRVAPVSEIGLFGDELQHLVATDVRIARIGMDGAESAVLAVCLMVFLYRPVAHPVTRHLASGQRGDEGVPRVALPVDDLVEQIECGVGGSGGHMVSYDRVTGSSA